MRVTAQMMGRSSYLTYTLGNSSNFRSNALSSILGNLSNSTTASGGSMYDLAAQFSSMKSNSSVLKAYYGNRVSSSTSTSKTDSINNKTTNTTSADSTEIAKAKTLQSSADKLKNAANALSQTGSGSLFKENEEGEYDMDKIVSAVKDFVDNYNSTKSAVVDSGNNRAIQTAVSMVSRSSSVEKTLNKVGITINNDNTLSVNEEKLKSANMSDLKSLFSGANSYAYGIAKQSAMIKDYATASMGKSSKYAGYYPTKGSAVDILA